MSSRLISDVCAGPLGRKRAVDYLRTSSRGRGVLIDELPLLNFIPKVIVEELKPMSR